MSKENPFKEEPIKGDGFIMKEGDQLSQPTGPSLEFRPRETSETARNREKGEKAMREHLRQGLSPEVKKTPQTPEEKARRAEEEAQGNRDWLVGVFENHIKEYGKYSEILGIKEDGTLDQKKRFDDDAPPLITVLDTIKTPEKLYQLMHKISQECSELDISFETDPTGKWIRYRVSRKVGDKK